MNITLPTLDDWALWRTAVGDLTLSGFVRGHPRLVDGTPVRTSPVQRLQGGVAVTVNSTYLLLARCADPRRWRLQHDTSGLNGATPLREIPAEVGGSHGAP